MIRPRSLFSLSLPQFLRWGITALILTSLAGVLFISTPKAEASFPRVLPFSARLKSASSESPVPDGTYTLTFKIYTTQTGGAPLWSEVVQVPVTQGLVSTYLGEDTPIPDTLTFNDGSYYLGVTVGSDPEMTPRRAVTAVPLSLNSATVDGAAPGTNPNNILKLDSTAGFSIAGPIVTASILQGGDTNILGTLTAQGAASLSSTLQVASHTSIGGDLTVQGAASIGGNLSIAGNLIPATSGSFDLGSASNPFNSAYINNLVVGTTSTAGTSNSSFTINQLATQDSDSALNFYRGGSLPAAQILWNSTAGQFELNENTSIAGSLDATDLAMNGVSLDQKYLSLGGGTVSGNILLGNGSGHHSPSLVFEKGPGVWSRAVLFFDPNEWLQISSLESNRPIGGVGVAPRSSFSYTGSAPAILIKPSAAPAANYQPLRVEAYDSTNPLFSVDGAGSLLAAGGEFTGRILGRNGMIITSGSKTIIDSFRTGNTNLLSTTNAVYSPLTVRGIAGQSAALTNWQDSSQSLLASVSATGQIYTAADLLADGGAILGGQALIQHLGSATNDSTQDALRIQPAGILAANYRGLAIYKNSTDTTPLIYTTQNGLRVGNNAFGDDHAAAYALSTGSVYVNGKIVLHGNGGASITNYVAGGGLTWGGPGLSLSYGSSSMLLQGTSIQISTDIVAEDALSVSGLLTSTGGITSPGTTGTDNERFGANALLSNTTGINNTAIGSQSLQMNTTGLYNTALGYNALNFNTVGFHNTALGATALRSNTTGLYNTAVGTNALFYNTSAYSNTAVGLNALYQNSTGQHNTGVGSNSLKNNDTGYGNSAFGLNAGYGGALHGSNITGNALFGYQAGVGLLTGADYNTILGYSAGSDLTTGARNILIGYNVQAASATGNDQLNIGNAITGNLATGDITIAGTLTSTGRITASGGIVSNIGTGNERFGQGALGGNHGPYNTALGAAALAYATGSSNVGVGFYALGYNVSNSGNENTAIGASALGGNTASGNVGVGFGALMNNTTGGWNAVVGYKAGWGTGSSSNVTGNVLFGYQAGYGLLTGANYNTALGYLAGHNLTTGARNILIGYNIQAASATGNDQLNIGNTITGNLATGDVGIAGLLTASGGITSPGSGTNSQQFGLNALSSGTQTLAVGRNASATVQLSVAVGDSAVAVSEGTTVGVGASANQQGVAIGRSARATASSGPGVAIGYSTQVAGPYSTAIGYGANAAGGESIALGTGASAAHYASIVIGRSVTSTANNQLVIGGNTYGMRIADGYFGMGVTAAAPQSFTLHATGGSGTDVAGANLQLAGGQGTGSASGGDILFQTSNPGASGTALRGLTTKMTIKASGRIGINTNNPTAKLQVVGSEDTQQLIVQAHTSQTANIVEVQDATGTVLATITPAGELKAAGIATAVATKTAAYTATASDSVLIGDTSGGAFTFTLPDASGVAGRQYTLKKSDSSVNILTVATSLSQTIDGATSYDLTTQYQYLTVVSDGSNWIITANNQ